MFSYIVKGTIILVLKLESKPSLIKKREYKTNTAVDTNCELYIYIYFGNILIARFMVYKTFLEDKGYTMLSILDARVLQSNWLGEMIGASLW